MKNVLTAGAAGYLGGYIVKELNKREYRVRALARSAAKLEGISESIDEHFIGQVTDKSSLEHIWDNIDTVITTVGITKQRDKVTYMDVDYQGNLNLLEEAMKAGVKKFIYVSVYKSREMTNIKAVQAKVKYEVALKSSGLDYSIIYPNGFFSDMLEYLAMAKKGRGYLSGKGDKKINPIHGADLAEVCVNAVESNERHVDAGGPDVFTHYEIMETAFEVLEKTVKITRLPVFG